MPAHDAIRVAPAHLVPHVLLLMSAVRSFPPIADPRSHTLILGSMPGVRSLAAGAYYAHPRNAFWPIVSRLLQLAPDASYAQRTDALRAAGFALWDVLETCIRPGSLDGAIQRDSRVPNDFHGFLARHPRIARIAFNGAEAERSFRRQVLPTLDGRTIEYHLLPSTSPAYTMAFEFKLAAWRAALGGADPSM